MPSTRVVASYCNVSCLLMQWLFVFSFATSHDRGMTPSCHGTTTPALTCEMRNTGNELVIELTRLYLEIKYSVRKPCWPRQAFGDITNPPTHLGSVRNGKIASSEDVDGCLLARRGLCTQGNPPFALGKLRLCSYKQ